MVDRHSGIYQENQRHRHPFLHANAAHRRHRSKRTPTPPKTSADNEVVTKNIEHKHAPTGYSRERIKQSLGWMSPVQYHQSQGMAA